MKGGDIRKILLDCTFLRNRATGVDVAFLNLLVHMLDIDNESFYIILIDSRFSKDILLRYINQYKNYKILRIYSPLPLQIIYSSYLIPFYLLLKKIDVYHNPYFFGPLWRSICPSTKIIITVHDMYHRTIPKMMNKYLNIVFKLFSDRAVKKADEVIVISTQTKNDVSRYLNIEPSRLNLIYQALNSLNSFENKNTLDDVIASDLIPNLYILTVGKVLPSKGIEDLISAYKLLRSKYSHFNIKLVSAGMHTSNYINKIKELINCSGIPKDDIKLLGYVDNKTLNSLYTHANMVVSPSHYEGFGIPVLEAMSFGKPLIARNTSSLVEVVGNAGLLFNDIDELASQMNNVIYDLDLRQHLIDKGYERVKDFSWPETAKKTLALYGKGVEIKKIIF